MKQYLVGTKEENGNWSVFCSAQRLDGAGDISLPLEDEDLRNAIEDGIRTLDMTPGAVDVTVSFDSAEYRISRK